MVPFAVIALVLVFAAAPALGKPPAGKGPKSSDSTIALDQPGPIYYGDTVTFTAQTATTDRPFVTVECFKSGMFVYSSTVGFFQDWYDEWGEPESTLASLAWSNGDADCVAEVWYRDRRYRERTLATLEFPVLGT